MGCPIRMQWDMTDNLWLRLAQGRAVLEAVTDWLAAGKGARRLRSNDPKPVPSWWFRMVLRRDRGAPKGYSTVTSPELLSIGNVQTFEDEFRRVAWIDSLPASAIVQRHR